MWIFDLILMLFWAASGSSPIAAAIYEQLVSSGATCYYYVPAQGESPAVAPPPCPYGDANK